MSSDSSDLWRIDHHKLPTARTWTVISSFIVQGSNVSPRWQHAFENVVDHPCEYPALRDHALESLTASFHKYE